MMDLHILIVIACVFLASLFSLLFINKFLRRKTFEEIVAEKKALTEKIYGKDKSTIKKPKKQSLKKELKREKKQQQKVREQHEDSDAQSEQPSVEEEPEGLSKTHVEFEPDPEIVTFNNQQSASSRRSSTAENEKTKQTNSKGKKDKKNNAKAGILLNKNDVVNVKESNANDTQTTTTNHFDVKTPKDAVELKKLEKKEEKLQHQNKKDKNAKKSDNKPPVAATNEIIQPVTEVAPPVVKEVKQLEDKVRQNSPKTNQLKNKQQNKKQKDSKELVAGLDKLSDSDTIGVSLLMNLFRRAELNRSEIQILIDYLLNRQQDMPASHSEWSDDICQKLKRQLEEKEKALVEEQEASIGIQAKLRELRTEINTERVNMSSTLKSCADKLAAKDQDIALLEQKIKTINDNLTLERQQFQAKLIHEKQTGSQDLLAQLQMMQNEMAHKDKCIAELTCIVNASRQAVEESQQKNEIIQNQVQQLRALELQRDELEQVSNNRIFELEKAKQLESELNELKLELLNAQNAIESTRSEANQNRDEMESVKNEIALLRSKELVDKQCEIHALNAKNSELMQQIAEITIKTEEQSKEQMMSKSKTLLESEQRAQKQQELEKLIESLKTEVANKDKQLQSTDHQMKQQQQELQNVLETLKADVSKKDEQLKDAVKQTDKLNSIEKELEQQLLEQKEKNNDLRIKNWKLVEALQNAETKVSKQSQNAILVQQEKLLASAKKTEGLVGQSTDSNRNQNQMRDLFQRLCPEAVKACAGTALSVSFDQWVEKVLATHIQQQQQLQQQQASTSSSHKSTQSNSHSPSANTQNSHANGSRSSGSSISNSSAVADTSGAGGGSSDKAELLKENSILRIRIDELTKLARKTEYTLSDLMKKAEEQEEHWRKVVLSKDDQINALQHSNGQQGI